MVRDNCNLCNKDKGKFEGLVWYSGNIPTYLCKSCYLKWTKSKECKELEVKFEGTKPCTTEWTKMCGAQQKAFDKWYYANGGIDDKSD